MESLLNPELPSAILCCEGPVEGKNTATILKNMPLNIFFDGRWHQRSAERIVERMDAGQIGLRTKKDPVIEALLEGKGAQITLLIDSPGGRTSATDVIAKMLTKGRERYGWQTQSLVGKKAASAAAVLAISAGNITASEESEFMFHHGFDEDGELNYENSDHEDLYETPYEQLNRLKSLAKDPSAFARSRIEWRFREVLDKPTVTSDDHIDIPASQLRDASALQLATRKEMTDTLSQILAKNPPAKLARQLNHFMKPSLL